MIMDSTRDLDRRTGERAPAAIQKDLERAKAKVDELHEEGFSPERLKKQIPLRSSVAVSSLCRRCCDDVFLAAHLSAGGELWRRRRS